VLIPAADELVTLTRGAADEIARRWGREATVLPHPHVVDLPSIDAPRAARAGTVVGIHLKSLRANVDPLPVVDTVAAAVAGCDDVVLRVDVHRDVMDPGGENHDAEVASRLRQAERAYYRDQHPCPTYGNNEVDGVDAASLADAVVTACRAAPPARPGRNRRTAERLALAREHERIYRRALDRVRGCRRCGSR